MSKRYASLPVLTTLFSAMLLYLVCASAAIAQTDTAKSGKNGATYTDEKLGQIEENLVKDLESPSVGVCIGGAQAVRDLKAKAPKYSFSKVIIPLMRLVKDENTDRGARILAALALFDLDSDRGNFAIQREGELSDDPVFKTLCRNLTESRRPSK